MIGFDRLLQDLANVQIAERENRWRLAHTLKAGYNLCTITERIGFLRSAASHLHCTQNYIRQLIEVSVAFPEGHKLPDVSWTLFRSCVAVSKRSGQDPQKILTDALEKGWHGAEVAAAYPQCARRMLRGRGMCGECNAKVEVRSRVGAGLRLVCPFCVSTDRAEGRQTVDLRRYVTVAVLE